MESTDHHYDAQKPGFLPQVLVERRSFAAFQALMEPGEGERADVGQSRICGEVYIGKRRAFFKAFTEYTSTAVPPAEHV